MNSEARAVARHRSLTVALIWSNPDVLMWCIAWALRERLEPPPRLILVRWSEDVPLPSWEHMADVAVVAFNPPVPDALRVRAPYIDYRLSEVYDALVERLERGHFREAFILGDGETRARLLELIAGKSRRSDEAKSLWSLLEPITGASNSLVEVRDAVSQLLWKISEKGASTKQSALSRLRPRLVSANESIQEEEDLRPDLTPRLRTYLECFERAWEQVACAELRWTWDGKQCRLPDVEGKNPVTGVHVTIYDGDRGWLDWPKDLSNSMPVAVLCEGSKPWDAADMASLSPRLFWPCESDWQRESEVQKRRVWISCWTFRAESSTTD